MKNKNHLILILIMILLSAILVGCMPSDTYNIQGSTSIKLIFDKEYDGLQIDCSTGEVVKVDSLNYTINLPNASIVQVIVSCDGYTTQYLNYTTKMLKNGVVDNIKLDKRDYILSMSVGNISNIEDVVVESDNLSSIAKKSNRIIAYSKKPLSNVKVLAEGYKTLEFDASNIYKNYNAEINVPLANNSSNNKYFIVLNDANISGSVRIVDPIYNEEIGSGINFWNNTNMQGNYLTIKEERFFVAKYNFDNYVTKLYDNNNNNYCIEYTSNYSGQNQIDKKIYINDFDYYQDEQHYNIILDNAQLSFNIEEVNNVVKTYIKLNKEDIGKTIYINTKNTQNNWYGQLVFTKQMYDARLIELKDIQKTNILSYDTTFNFVDDNNNTLDIDFIKDNMTIRVYDNNGYNSKTLDIDQVVNIKSSDSDVVGFEIYSINIAMKEEYQQKYVISNTHFYISDLVGISECKIKVEKQYDVRIKFLSEQSNDFDILPSRHDGKENGFYKFRILQNTEFPIWFEYEVDEFGDKINNFSFTSLYLFFNTAMFDYDEIGDYYYKEIIVYETYDSLEIKVLNAEQIFNNYNSNGDNTMHYQIMVGKDWVSSRLDLEKNAIIVDYIKSNNIGKTMQIEIQVWQEKDYKRYLKTINITREMLNNGYVTIDLND